MNTEALAYIDGRFSRCAQGKRIMIATELLLDAFDTIESASEWYDKKGGELRPSHSGLHMLIKRGPTQ